MKQKITVAVYALAATGVGGWVLTGAHPWVSLAIVAVIIVALLGFFVVFVRASPAKRRDIIDLFHGRRPEKGHSEE